MNRASQSPNNSGKRMDEASSHDCLTSQITQPQSMDNGNKKSKNELVNKEGKEAVKRSTPTSLKLNDNEFNMTLKLFPPDRGKIECSKIVDQQFSPE